jgi:hypothetical protein
VAFGHLDDRELVLMPPVIPAAPDARAEQVRELIVRAREEGMIVLTSLSAAELCMLGGPRHASFDELTAHAWLGLKDRQRRKLTETSTADLVGRRLLIPDPAARDPQDEEAYALSTELGVILAARTRPSFLVITEIIGARLRQPMLFALGDAQDPVQAMLLETPVAVPGSDPRPAAKLGPLGESYAYALGTRDWAAEYLADWLIRPAPSRPDVQPGASRAAACLHPFREDGSAGYRVTVHGDGTTADVDTGDGEPVQTCDRDQLRVIMADLINTGLR